MNYYQLNRDKLLEKGKSRYHNGCGKEKAARYYEDNQEVLREKAVQKLLWRNYAGTSLKKKRCKRVYGRDRYQNINNKKMIEKIFIFSNDGIN